VLTAKGGTRQLVTGAGARGRWTESIRTAK
jgi:hypothetical protein